MSEGPRVVEAAGRVPSKPIALVEDVGAEATKIQETVKKLEETELADLNRELDAHVRRYCSFNIYPTHMEDLKTM